MSEALARVRNEVLSRRVDLKRAGGRAIRMIPRGFFSLTPRAYATAALAALVAGIAVNALVLQRGRHPAPLFPAASEPAAPVTVNLQKAAPVAVAPAPASAPQVAAAPPAKPAAEAPVPDAASAVTARRAPAPVAEAGKHDPIGDLLHQEKTSDEARLLRLAHAPLVKLGLVKADASEAAIRSAVHDFMRAHGMSATSELTPRVVKRLNEAAKSAEKSAAR